MTVLHGERITLRPLQPADAARIRDLRPPGWSPLDEDWPLGKTRSTRYAILLDGVIVGFIQFGEEDDPEYRSANIDVFLGAGARGQGLGTDAVRTLVLHLVRDRGHHRVTIDPRAENTAAIHCYRKVGFKPVGIMRRYERDHETGEWKDGLLMDLLAEEVTEPR